MNKKQILTNEIIERIDKLRKEKYKEFKSLMPEYVMAYLLDSNKSETAHNKMKILSRLLFDYNQIESIIKNLKWTLFNDEFEPYKNEYGLFFTRLELFFDLEFFDLPLDDQVNILLVEIFNGYSEKGSMNEAFLGLCHFGFIDYKPVYSQSKRSSLVNMAKDEGFNIPILFDRDIKTRRFINHYLKKNKIVGDIHRRVEYCFITQSGGWYSNISGTPKQWQEYFEQLKKEA